MADRMMPSGISRPDNVGNPGFQNRKWHPAATCIAMGMTTKKTAEHCNVSVGTLQHWRRHPKFQAYVNRIHDECINAAIGIITDAATKSAQVIVTLLDSESDTIRLQATDRVKEWMKLFRNDKLVLEKLETLEKMMSNANSQSLPEPV